MFLLLITLRIAIRLFSFNKILLFIKKLAFDGFYPLPGPYLLPSSKLSFIVDRPPSSFVLVALLPPLPRFAVNPSLKIF